MGRGWVVSSSCLQRDEHAAAAATPAPCRAPLTSTAPQPACPNLRRSQKRSAPSKWPDASMAPSAVNASAWHVDGHMSERRCRPSVRPHTCGGGCMGGGWAACSAQRGARLGLVSVQTALAQTPGPPFSSPGAADSNKQTASRPHLDGSVRAAAGRQVRVCWAAGHRHHLARVPRQRVAQPRGGDVPHPHRLRDGLGVWVPRGGRGEGQAGEQAAGARRAPRCRSTHPGGRSALTACLLLAPQPTHPHPPRHTCLLSAPSASLPSQVNATPFTPSNAPCEWVCEKRAVSTSSGGTTCRGPFTRCAAPCSSTGWGAGARVPAGGPPQGDGRAGRAPPTRSVVFREAVKGSHSFTALSAPPLASRSPVRLKARP